MFKTRRSESLYVFVIVVCGCSKPSNPTVSNPPVAAASDRQATMLQLQDPDRDSAKKRNAEDPDMPEEAARFRYLQTLSDDGTIPPNAIVTAKTQLDAMIAAAAQQGGIANGGLGPHNWQWLGPPTVGGRIRGLATRWPNGPGDFEAERLWVGAALGGVWRRIGNQSWTPMTDFIANLAVGCMAASYPDTDPDHVILFVGTGEGFFNGDAVPGAGIFRSMDGGATWAQLPATIPTPADVDMDGTLDNDPGLLNWGFVNRIAVSPASHQTLLVATSNGIYRTTNAAAANPAAVTFAQVTTQRALDVDFDPNNANNAVAGLDDRTVIRSTDGGVTWPGVAVLSGTFATTLNAAHAAGVTVLNVASTAEFQVGDIIEVDSGANLQIHRITVVGGATFTVVPATAVAHAAGTAVAITGRSATTLTAAFVADGNAAADNVTVAASAGFLGVGAPLNWFDRIFIDAGANREAGFVVGTTSPNTVTLVTSGTADLQNNHAAGVSVRVGGRVEVAYSRSNPGVVYASVEATAGTGSTTDGLHRSADGGATWAFRSSLGFTPPAPPANNIPGVPTRVLAGQGSYDNALWVDPTASNWVVIGGVDLVRYRNDLNTVTQIGDWRRVPAPGDSVHADHHAILAEPDFDLTHNRVYFGNDGGVYASSDYDTATHNTLWSAVNDRLGVTQFYAGAFNPTSNRFMGGTQDNATHMYNFNSNSWSVIGGQADLNGDGTLDTFRTGDGGYCAAPPSNGNRFYHTYPNLAIFRSSDGGATSQFISGGIADGMVANFIAPILLDPNVPYRILAGSGDLWETPDSTVADPTLVAWNSIFANPNGSLISAIAARPNGVQAPNTDSRILYVGYNNGDLYRTNDYGVDALAKVDPAAMPNRFLTSIAIDPSNTNTVYVAFGGYNKNAATNNGLWRSTDGGATWSLITGATLGAANRLPNLPVRTIAIHPTQVGWLYIGTDLGVFVSTNANAAAAADVAWSYGVPPPQMNDGPANVEVAQLIFKDNRTLLALTHGRGLYMADAGGQSDGSGNGIETLRVSLDSNEVQGNNISFSSAISRDGRFVVFRSSATNLVVGDTNLVDDVFVRDRGAGTTERVSVSSSGGQANGTSYSGNVRSISANGRYVVFASEATNLVAGDTNGKTDVFLRDRQTGLTERVSLSYLGLEANDTSGGFGAAQCSVSEDGRYVVFESLATNLDPPDTNGFADIFVRDRVFQTTYRVNVGPGGAQANFTSRSPVISSDGSTVVFLSGANNLLGAGGDTNGKTDAFARLLALNSTVRVSLTDALGEPNGDTYSVDVSRDGRYFAFDSGATNIVANDTNAMDDIFVYDSNDGLVERVNVGAGGAQANGFTISESISDDGRFVAFSSDATNLVAGDTNGQRDTFIRDRQLKQTRRVRGMGGAQGNGSIADPSMAGNGRVVSVTSTATNLVPNDTNGAADVFAADFGPCYGQVCDTNCDGTVNPFDIQGFVTALTSELLYAANYPGCSYVCANDVNGDGTVSAFDVGPFLECMKMSP